LQKQLQESPGNAQHRLELGLYWAQMGDLQRAEPFLRAAAAALPHDVDAQRAWAMWLGHEGLYAEAAQVAGRPDVASALRAESTVLRAAAETGQQLDRVLETGGSIELQALREYAQSEFDGERVDRAAAALVQLLRQEPADRAALHLLGEMQVRSKLRVVAARLTPRSLRPVEPGRDEGRAAP
jgi:tetratricopeptide (TPR) repeat protein